MSFYILGVQKPPIPYQLSLRRPFSVDEISQLILYSMIFVSGTLGNGLVINVFRKATDRPGSRFVIILAVIDLVTSVITPLNNILTILYDFQHWPLGKIGCFLLKPWMESTFFASAWILVAISAERFR